MKTLWERELLRCSGDMMLQTLSLPKYREWAHYDDWLGLNGARIMLEMMMGY